MLGIYNMVLTVGILIFCDTALCDKTAMVWYMKICWGAIAQSWLKVASLNKKLL